LQEGKSVPVPSKGTCSGCYRGHGVSFTYPPRWQKTEDVKAPISDLWYVVLSLHEPAGYVKVVGQGQSEFGFPVANLAAGRAYWLNQPGVPGYHPQAGAQKLTIDGRPGLRFWATQSARGKVIKYTMAVTFKEKTQYYFECAHTKRRSQIERGCAEVVRTFEVETPKRP
jgi:hypothetical protein